MRGWKCAHAGLMIFTLTNYNPRQKVRSQLTTFAEGRGIMKAQVRDKASDATASAMKNLSENVVLMLTQGGLMSYNMKYEFGEFC